MNVQEFRAELRAWLDGFWDDALEDFKLEAERSAQARKSK